MRAILLGDRTGIPEHIRELFVKTGTAHILAISGLHVGIVAGLFLVFVRILPVSRRCQLVAAIILLAGYALMTGARPSVVRAAIMASVFLAGFIFAVSLAIILVYWITTPINSLSNAAKKLAQNAFEGKLPDISKNAPREIKQLGDSINDLITGLQYSRVEVNILNESLQARVDEATEELLIANNELSKLAHNDFLTSLANRRLFESELASNLKRRDTDGLTILLIDIDNFKEINDTHGHSAGDSILIQLAEFLDHSMRDNDLLARYGGDEIAAQLNCSPEIARDRAEAIRDKVEKHGFKWDNKIFNITISIGLLDCQKYNFDDIKNLLEKVDSALYVAKKAGRNIVIEYNAEKLAG